MASIPAGLVLSLIGLWRDRPKVYAIMGTIIAGLTLLLYAALVVGSLLFLA